jgi:hypothetical protein
MKEFCSQITTCSGSDQAFDLLSVTSWYCTTEMAANTSAYGKEIADSKEF